MSPISSIAHYRISGKLGEGGMGAVYRATDTKLQREVAIKVLPDVFAKDPDRLARFSREAQVLASLNHPNIAVIHGVEERALVMELVGGSTLSGPLTEEEALPIVHQLIDALEYAHEKGIVHRDLKPANIKLTPEGRVKVLDFGLAKALSSDAVNASDRADLPTLTMRATMAGVIMGTAAYMAPEQARGQNVDKRADIWSFGVVVYELLTGKALFDGESVSDVLASVLRQDPDMSPVPARFRKLLRLCLTRDPRARLRDISGARLLLDEMPAAAAVPVMTRRVWPWIAATMVAATAAAAAGIVAWRTSGAADRPFMQFSVDLGPEAVAAALDVIAISPDARRFVFTARSAEGKSILELRALDQQRADLLRGTEGGQEPFFSPSGEWIGFFADGKLKKVSVHGGAPIALADVSANPRGGSWGDDGQIVFAGNPAGPLSRVSENGGTVQTLTNPTSTGQATHRWPAVLPGSRAVLFTANKATWGLNDSEIDVLDASGGKIKAVHRGGFAGRYLAPGKLLYVHDGVLFATAFDPDRLEERGQPVRVLENVAANVISAAGRYSFGGTSVSGLLFAYMSGNAAEVSARLVWLDAKGDVSPLPFPGGTSDSSISPDGKLIAFTSGGIDTSDIKVWDTTREMLVSVTTDGRGHSYPVWAPDSRHLAFRSLVKDGYGLSWARFDGGGQVRTLLEAKLPIIPSSISPDGRRIGYTQISTAGSMEDIWTLPIDKSDPENPKPGAAEPFLQTPGTETHVTFSPDGQWVAYASNDSGAWEAYVRPFPGPGTRSQISGGSGYHPRWSPSAQQILYATDEGHIMAVDYQIKGGVFSAGRPRLWSETRIASNFGRATFELTPDGKRVLTGVAPGDVSPQTSTVHATFLLNFGEELDRRLAGRRN